MIVMKGFSLLIIVLMVLMNISTTIFITVLLVAPLK